MLPSNRSLSAGGTTRSAVRVLNCNMSQFSRLLKENPKAWMSYLWEVIIQNEVLKLLLDPEEVQEELRQGVDGGVVEGEREGGADDAGEADDVVGDVDAPRAVVPLLHRFR